MSQNFANDKVAILIELRRLIDEGLFHDAMTLASGVDESTFTSPEEFQHAQFLSLKGKILYHLTRHEEAVRTAELGLAIVKASGENNLIAELQSTIARSFTEMGRISEAERVYRDLVSTYRRLDNTSGMISSLNRLSRLFFIKGQFGKAVEYLIEADDYANSIPDLKWKAMINGNLGTIFNLIGEFHKAAEYLERSIEVNLELKNDLNLSRALLSLAYSRMHLKEFRSAEQLIARAEAIIISYGYDSERPVLNQYRGELALMTSDPTTARECANLVQASCSANRESVNWCQAERLIAEAFLSEGQFEMAMTHATTALYISEKIGESVETGICRRIIAEAYHGIHNFKKAESYFSSATECLAEIGSRFQLAKSYSSWSRCTNDSVARNSRSQEAERALIALRLDSLYGKKTRSQATLADASTILVGESPNFVSLVREAEQCANSDIPILLLGETGSGKDQFARFIHSKSDRHSRPYVQVNCAAIPMELAESELFGYERGAFTNASDQKQGLIEAADGGTLFLNEIGELPMRLQSKLLTALDEKRFYKLGGTNSRKVDFRLIAATNVDLTQAVIAGKFRADLFYRLAVMTLSVPKLSERGTDAFLLFKSFLEEAQISIDQADRRSLAMAEKAINSYNWPGNVRELRNMVQLYMVSDARDASSICQRIVAKIETLRGSKRPVPAEQMNLTEAVEQFERAKIFSALGDCGGIIRRAAAALGLPEATLRSKLKKYRISAA